MGPLAEICELGTTGPQALVNFLADALQIARQASEVVELELAALMDECMSRMLKLDVAETIITRAENATSVKRMVRDMRKAMCCVRDQKRRRSRSGKLSRGVS